MAARLPNDIIQQIVRLRREGRTTREIADEVGICASTVSRHLKKYSANSGGKGEPPPGRPIGQAIDRTDIDGSVDLLKLDRPATLEELMQMCNLDPSMWIPQWFKPNSWQGYYKVDTPDGHRKVQLYQSKAVFKRIITEEIQAAILEFVQNNVTAVPAPPRRKKKPAEGFAVSWGIWDAHLGLYAWQSEVGEDFDLSMATNRVLNSIDDMVEELKLYPIEKIWMPVGNDFIHFDSVRNTTTMGDHFLDTDTRYAKVYTAALTCLVYMVQRALELTDEVDIMYVPGNHDYTSSFTLTAALDQRFRNDPRVKVDLGANPRKYRQHGGVLLGYEHGQKCKANQLSLIFSEECRAQWSESTYREIQIGHTHQRRLKTYEGLIPTNGVTIRTNPTLCNVDKWHHDQGLIGEPVKSVEAWRYDRVAYRGSHSVWARDDRRDE